MQTINPPLPPKVPSPSNDSPPSAQPAVPGEAHYGVNALPQWKRVFDIVVIIAAAPVWFPMMIFISLWIKLVSPGPVFFRQQRVGLHGKKFMMLKFRSMKPHAETDNHENHFDHLVQNNQPMTKLDVAGDHRMISSGWILRATGLDELPQLFNVIRGNMSLVGPRPCTPRELANFQPAQLERFNATPGLTGYWQVNGKNKTTFNEMIDLDVFYARNLSLRLDLAIIRKTIPALLAQVSDSQKVREPSGVRETRTAN